MNYLLVFLGGGLGSVLRFGVHRSAALFYHGAFPLGTLIANIFACLLLGMILLFFKEKTGITEWQLFLITGVCGGFSTFSTFSFETVQLIHANNYLMAGLNILISVLSCILLLYFLIKVK